VTGASRMLRAALIYISLGWPVFLLAEGSKVPKIGRRLGGHGLYDATLDPEQATIWWSRHPNANIGVRSGEISQLVVVDSDPRHGGDDTLVRLQRRHGPLLDTLEAVTATGGGHRFFKYPVGVVLRNTAALVGPGIDSRADGGYFVAAPSVRSEGRYRWVNWGTPPAELPEWLLVKLRKPEPPKPVPIPRSSLDAIGDSLLRQKAEAVATARHETRNHVLNASAYALGRLVGARALDAAEVEAVLAGAARRSGLDEHEIMPTIRSGLTAGMARPRVSA